MRQEDIGFNVKQLRERSGLSVKELAEMAGVSASYVYSIEAGTRGSNIHKLNKIAGVFGVTVIELWKEVSSPLQKGNREGLSNEAVEDDP